MPTREIPLTADPVSRFVAALPFALDPFQNEAIAALTEGRSVLVAAPTGTGKTVVAEFAVDLALSRGVRAIYTTPIKALSNQKFRDFRARYADRVGLLTGDLVENPNGRLLVMTTEVARNMLVQDPGSFQDVGALIFDEVHYLADPERGTAWEESILLAPAHVPLVCLSATVANAAEIAEWIRTTGRNVALVESSERVVPLRQRYYLDGQLIPVLNGQSPLRLAPYQKGGERAGRIRTGHGIGDGSSTRGRRAREDEPPGPPEVLRALAEADLLPAIYFLFSRKAVEEAAESCQRLHLLPGDQAAEVRRLARERLADLPGADSSLAQVERLLGLLPKGVGFHHAGLLPPLKTMVEELLAAGLLRVVFATDTLALGINVPARSVVVGEMTKFDGQNRRLLSPGEYRQLTGRAGRRGMDAVGYSVLLYSPWVSVDRSLEIAAGDVAPLQSAFRPGYSTVLNLWRGPKDEDQLAHLFAASLRQFQEGGMLRDLADEHELAADALAAIPTVCPVCGDFPRWMEQEKGLKRELDKIERVATAEARRREIVLSLSQNPYRTCPHRPLHRRAERDRRHYVELMASVDRDLATARRDTGYRAQRTLRSLRSVLETFGYMASGRPTPKARMLMRLFDSNGLAIAELLDWGVLADASPAEIAEVASWFAFDKEGYGRALSLTERLARIRGAAEAAAKRAVEVERRHGMDLSRPLSPTFRGVALAWASGTELAALSARSGLAEGDIVFALQKTIDLCRQIGHAAIYSRTPSIASGAVEAEKLLRQGVVAGYYRWVVAGS